MGGKLEPQLAQLELPGGDQPGPHLRLRQPLGSHPAVSKHGRQLGEDARPRDSAQREVVAAVGALVVALDDADAAHVEDGWAPLVGRLEAGLQPGHGHDLALAQHLFDELAVAWLEYVQRQRGARKQRHAGQRENAQLGEVARLELRDPHCVDLSRAGTRGQCGCPPTASGRGATPFLPPISTQGGGLSRPRGVSPSTMPQSGRCRGLTPMGNPSDNALHLLSIDLRSAPSSLRAVLDLGPDDVEHWLERARLAGAPMAIVCGPESVDLYSSEAGRRAAFKPLLESLWALGRNLEGFERIRTREAYGHAVVRHLLRQAAGLESTEHGVSYATCIAQAR